MNLGPIKPNYLNSKKTATEIEHSIINYIA